MGLGHGYFGEIDTSVIAWYRSLGTLIHKSSWDGFSPLHAWCVQICVPCDCVIVCYTLRGKHIHGMMYMGNAKVRNHNLRGSENEMNMKV